MRCTCGCRVTYDPKERYDKVIGEKKKYDYYRCANGKHKHDKLIYVSEDKIMDTLGEAVSKISITDDLAKDISNALDETHRRVQNARTREIEGYKAALVAIEDKEDEVYQDLKCGLLDDEAYQRQVKKVREERMRMTDLMAMAQKMIGGAYLTTAKKILELANCAKSIWEKKTKEEKRNFLV